MPELETTIDRLDDHGVGLGETDGQTVHVAGALPPERWRVRVEHRSPHTGASFAQGITRLGAASPDRVTPACPAAGQCGGCRLQHLAYPEQLALKRRRVAGALAAAGIDANVLETLASPALVGYRNRAKYVLAASPGGLVHGSYAPRTHRVVPMTGCQVPEAPLGAVADAFVTRLDAAGLKAYDESTRQGELRYLVLRRAVSGSMLAVVVTRSDDPRTRLAEVARHVAGAHPDLAGVVHDVNPTTGGALLSGRTRTLHGEPVVWDQVGPVPLRLSALAFAQVNRAQAARLYAAVADAARGTDRVLDLFSGAGGIALTLGHRGTPVLGIETSAAAVADARASARRAGLSELARFEACTAAEGFSRAQESSVVVVNPPRKGLGAPLREALAASRIARLAYVSCGPDSLARDAQRLVDAGFIMGPVATFDLMPGTPEVESLAVFTRP